MTPDAPPPLIPYHRPKPSNFTAISVKALPIATWYTVSLSYYVVVLEAVNMGTDFCPCCIGTGGAGLGLISVHVALQILQSCGKHMMYNPKTMTCDSVANVRALRPECAEPPPGEWLSFFSFLLQS